MPKDKLNYIERHGKLRSIKIQVMWRYWELDALHKELFRMSETAKTQARFCLCRQPHAIITKYIAEIDRLSLRVSVRWTSMTAGRRPWITGSTASRQPRHAGRRNSPSIGRIFLTIKQQQTMSDNEYSADEIQQQVLGTYFQFRSNLPKKDEAGRDFKKSWKTTEDIAEELSSMISIRFEVIASYMMEHGYSMGTQPDGTVAWALWEKVIPIR